MKKILVISGLALFVVVIGVYCSGQREQTRSQQTYLNLNDTVDYVGMATCRSCHQNVYNNFIHTGMGQSFDKATKEKSAAHFGPKALVYDSLNDFYYKPYWEGDSLIIMEYRLSGKDTVHKRKETIDYIVGSGQHTNSHIVNFHGYFYQAPITFYTQQGVWDLAPGFDKGFNSRFTRKIGMECMTCHNGLPEHVPGSANKFKSVKQGIDCERCHGPGELHVQRKRKGIRVDTSKYIDSTIVNPKHLSTDLQMSLCKRCHLQGVSVLREGKSFADFQPGMHLSRVMNTFLPKFKGAQEKFIMASHVERLMQSQCYIESKKLSCITCHNPHISVKETPVNTFNRSCQKCHGTDEPTKCTASFEQRQSADNNCVKCHMSQSKSIDIPHVAITDHNIRIPVDDTTKSNIQQFIRLACLTQDHPSAKTKAKGYLAFYEKFSSQQFALDSAEKLLVENSNSVHSDLVPPIIHLFYLKNDYEQILHYVKTLPQDSIRQGWTAYRIGEAHLQLGNFKQARNYFKHAVDLKPYNLEFNNKLGSIYMQLKQIEKAEETFEFITSENPKYVPALSNLGYVYLRQNKARLANVLYNKAIGLDPDYVPALLNKAGLLLYKKQYKKGRELLERILRLDPGNHKARQALQQLSTIQ